MSIAFQDKLIDTLTDRVSTRQEAIDLKVGTKINLYDAKEELEKSQSALASDQGQLIETDAALNELQSEKVKALSQFIADNENKLGRRRRARPTRRARRSPRRARGSRAPSSSRRSTASCSRLSVTTIGQVVTTGQQLVVDHAERGRAAGRGAGRQSRHRLRQARPGGRGQGRRLPVHPLRRAARQGRRIAAEAVDEQEAKRALANATTPRQRRRRLASAPGQAQSFVFPVTIALDETAMRRRRRDDPADAGHDGDGRDQDRQPPGDRLSAVAARQDGSEAMSER